MYAPKTERCRACRGRRAHVGVRTWACACGRVHVGVRMWGGGRVRRCGLFVVGRASNFESALPTACGIVGPQKRGVKRVHVALRQGNESWILYN